MKSFPYRRALAAGLIVGTLDITAALLNYYIQTGKEPWPVLKFVASGVFGKTEAYTSGSVMYAWGLFFHYIIAMGFTFLYFILYRSIPALGKNRILSGIGYGLFVWAFMQFVIVPMSNTPTLPFKWKGALIGAGILIICIGIPLAFLARKSWRQSSY